MPKRKCFFAEPPKNRICFRISTGDTTSSKTGIPFRSSACHRSHRGRDLPTVGERSGLVKTRTQGRAIGASAACSPGSSRQQHLARDAPLCTPVVAVRKTGPGACYKSAPLPPASHSAPNAPRFRPTRTHPFRHPTHPSVRTHPATIPFPPAKPNQLRGINNLHAHTSHPSHPL